MEKRMQVILLWAAFTIFAAGGVLFLLRGDMLEGLLCMFGAFAALIARMALLRGAAKTARRAAWKAEADRAAQQRETERQIEESRAETRAQMEEFRSLLSHQIRMPLSVVQGYADMLVQGIVEEEDKKQEYLSKISGHTRLISEALSQQLRTIEDARDAAAKLQRLDVAELLRQAAADMEAIAADNGVTIQVLTAQDEIWMDADRFQLNKALFNIIENSCKYMGRPGIVTLRANCGEDWVSISVKDDGLGLTQEETAHIFERGYQGSNGGSGHGHGHGLYIVRNAVEAHRGRVEAHSALGLGMEIKMTLPRQWKEPEAEETL